MVTAPRRSKSAACRASNSSRNQPTPTPTVTRPPDSTSMVAIALAVKTGLRCGTIMTLLTMRSFSVAPAMKDIVVSVSSASPLLRNLPSAV